MNYSSKQNGNNSVYSAGRGRNGVERVRIDTNDAKVKKILEMLHRSLDAKVRRGKNSAKDDYVTENKIFSILCKEIEAGPIKCADLFKTKYGEDITEDEVIRIFRSRKVANPVERKELLKWAVKVADLFVQAISGNKDQFEAYEKFRQEAAFGARKHASQARVAALMIYERHPEIDIFGDSGDLQFFGDTLAKYFFYDISDAIREVYEYPQYKDGKDSDRKVSKKNTYDLAQAVRRVEQLEAQLDRTNCMLQDLQDEFSEQLDESRTKELIEFFSNLNSEKYGSILDELLSVRKGIDEVKKEGYVLPEKISGLIIMIKQLMMFVRNSHIEPIMRTNAIIEVSASDVEFCNYEGTPFKFPQERKKVVVLSPGWIYKDKDIQISRPKVREVI